MWTEYPTHFMVRALGPEKSCCSNPVPSHIYSVLSQVYFLRDERTYKLDCALLYPVSPGVVLNGVTQCPSGRGP